MMGIVAAHLTLNPNRLNRWALPLFLVLLISLCFVAPLPYAKLWDNGFFLIVGAFLGFLIVIAAAQHRWLNQIFSNRALVAVGVASYSIYLVHDPVVKGFVRHGFSPWTASAIGIIAGFAFWALFERPFVQSPRIRDTLIARVLGFLSPIMARIGVRRSLFFERHISPSSSKQTLRS
jgi:peptidoglycan/LPS O-acetylase OafA/YrhL